MIFEIKINNLSKKFNTGFSLDHVDLHFSSPAIVCILGQNGAGKSTLFQLLTGNLEADSGEIYYGKERVVVDNYLLKRKIGYLPQKPLLPKWITALEVLRYAAHLHGVSDSKNLIKELLSYWDCSDYAKRALYNCSHGMQKRVGLALSSLHDPEYLILDEPFAGLDLSHIYSLEKYIKKRYDSGRMTLLSTHLAPYAASLCTSAYIIKEGKISSLENWSALSYENRLACIRDYFFKTDSQEEKK